MSKLRLELLIDISKNFYDHLVEIMDNEDLSSQEWQRETEKMIATLLTDTRYCSVNNIEEWEIFP